MAGREREAEKRGKNQPEGRHHQRRFGDDEKATFGWRRGRRDEEEEWAQKTRRRR